MARIFHNYAKSHIIKHWNLKVLRCSLIPVIYNKFLLINNKVYAHRKMAKWHKEAI